MMINSLLIFSILVLHMIPTATNAQQNGRIKSNYDTPEPASGMSAKAGNVQLFDIYIGNNHIGSYKASMIRRGNITEYRAVSVTTVRIIAKIKIGYELICIYRDGMLIRSRVQSFRNDKLRSETEITWTGDLYDIAIDGVRTIRKEPINKSSIQLYFTGPPEHTETVFSEREAKMKQVTKVADREYLVADPGKSRGTKFIYSNTGLKGVDIAFALGSFSLVRPGEMDE